MRERIRNEIGRERERESYNLTTESSLSEESVYFVIIRRRSSAAHSLTFTSSSPIPFLSISRAYEERMSKFPPFDSHTHISRSLSPSHRASDLKCGRTITDGNDSDL